MAVKTQLATAGVLWMGTSGVLLAQAGAFPEIGGAAPTTVVGALIAVTMSMVGGYWYIIKRLFETIQELRLMVEGNQRTFTITIQELQKGYSLSLDKLIEDRASDRADSAERRASDHKTMMALARQNTKTPLPMVRDDEETKS